MMEPHNSKWQRFFPLEGNDNIPPRGNFKRIKELTIVYQSVLCFGVDTFLTTWEKKKKTNNAHTHTRLAATEPPHVPLWKTTNVTTSQQQQKHQKRQGVRRQWCALNCAALLSVQRNKEENCE